MQQTVMTYASVQAVTPSDTTLVNCRALYIGGAGNVTISTDANAAGVLITAPPVGMILPIMLDKGRVLATGTTATAIVALA